MVIKIWKTQRNTGYMNMKAPKLRRKTVRIIWSPKKSGTMQLHKLYNKSGVYCTLQTRCAQWTIYTFLGGWQEYAQKMQGTLSYIFLHQKLRTIYSNMQCTILLKHMNWFKVWIHKLHKTYGWCAGPASYSIWVMKTNCVRGLRRVWSMTIVCTNDL